MKKHHIHGIEFNKAQRGWNCEIYFRCETHRQSTWETVNIRGSFGNTRWQWVNIGFIGFVLAWVNAYRNMFKHIEELRALGGEHNYG